MICRCLRTYFGIESIDNFFARYFYRENLYDYRQVVNLWGENFFFFFLAFEFEYNRFPFNGKNVKWGEAAHAAWNVPSEMNIHEIFLG